MAQKGKRREAIDLNRADGQQLMAIEGIDGARARALIDWRREHGGFRSIDQVDEVPGFDGVLLQKVKRTAYVGGERRRSHRAGREAPERRGPEAQRAENAEHAEERAEERAGPAERIDLNTAGSEELRRIEGVDGERAEAILRYRGEHGPFRSWRDVDAVPGVDDVMLAKIREAATVGPEREEERAQQP